MSRHFALPVCLLALIFSACGTYQIHRVAIETMAPDAKAIPASSTYLWITRDGSGQLHMEELTLPDPEEAWFVQAPGGGKKCPFCSLPDIELDAQGRVAGISLSGWEEMDAMTSPQTPKDCEELTGDTQPGLYKVCPGGSSAMLHVREIFLTPAPVPHGSLVQIDYRAQADRPELVKQIVVHVPGVPASKLSNFQVETTCPTSPTTNASPCNLVTPLPRYDFGVIVIDVKPYKELHHFETTLSLPSGWTRDGWPVRSSFPRATDKADWRPHAEVEILSTKPPQVVVLYDPKGGSPIDVSQINVLVYAHPDQGPLKYLPAEPNTESPLVSTHRQVFSIPVDSDTNVYTVAVTVENQAGLKSPAVLKTYEKPRESVGPMPSHPNVEARITQLSYRDGTLELSIEDTECLHLGDALQAANQSAWEHIECIPETADTPAKCEAKKKNGGKTFTFPCKADGCADSHENCLEVSVEAPVGE